ncbi:MAG: oxygen-independent coproporphyrinogen III oxidase [Gemmatimonadaceae bacterium]|nr:oxygen-independent coproporphyrinogen III oxidase [Gemmatimonadaceae bacterium]
MRADKKMVRSLGTIRRMAVPQVSPGLLQRYDVSVPRYTSYPAVPDWTGTFTRDAWRQHLGTLNGSADPLALYVHLPFCASRCFYCGCNATVTRRAEVVDRYLDRLDGEMQLLAEAIGTPPRISEMHWGGGTPNFLSAPQLTRLMSMLHRHFPIDARTECSVEADPRLVTRQQLEQLRQLGFSRISFGVQDLDPGVQNAIGRVQPQSLVATVVRDAREVGFGGVNLDLIYGLPEQTPESFASTIEESLALAPDRVACFGYAHVPWLRANQKRINDASLPVGAERFSLFRDAVSRFVDAGYDWLGIDHFALPEDPLSLAARAGRLHRNFMGYTTRTGENLLGIGTSAISQVNGWYVQNSPQLGDWQQDLDQGTLSITRGHVMSPDDVARGTAVGHLMCNTELPFDLFVGDMYELTDRFEAFASEGLVEFESDRVVVTPLGRFFLRNLCATLDAYRIASDLPGRFSRAV